MNNKYSSVYERSVTTTSIREGRSRRNRQSDTSDEQPHVAVEKDKSQIYVPDWMEEQKSPELKRRDVDPLNIDIFLTFPSNKDTVRMKDHEDTAKESIISPEVAKRDEQVIPVLPYEEDDEESEDDEFEEDIVVVNVVRHPLWRKGLQIPKLQREQVGMPIADLLEVPTRQPKQESSSYILLVNEKVESVERPPVTFAELPVLSIF